MPQQNNIAVQVPAAVLAHLTDLLTEAKNILDPFMVSLTGEQKQTILKMGDNSIAFVNKTDGYIATNPEFVPAFLNVDDFRVDVEAVKQLAGINKLAAQLSENLNDTITLSGSEAFMAALIYYHSVKQAAANSIPGAKTIYDDLSQRFPGRGGKTPKP